MLRMRVQVTFAWLDPLRVLSSALVPGVVRRMHETKQKSLGAWPHPCWTGGGLTGGPDSALPLPPS